MQNVFLQSLVAT